MSDYQVMPPLSGDEFESLKADIEARGVLVPVEYDESGNILDGHHRVRICSELGISAWPRMVRKGLSEDDKRSHARSLNLARRHLNQEQRRDLIRDQLKDTPEKSDRQIAKALGVDNSTVSAHRKKMVGSGELLDSNSSIGADGKKRPRATKPKSVYLSEDDARKVEKLPDSHGVPIAETCQHLADDWIKFETSTLTKPGVPIAETCQHLADDWIKFETSTLTKPGVPIAETCQHCHYFAATDDNLGECRRNAPVLMDTSEFRVFPIVDKTDWCGVFQSKSDA